MSLSIYVGVSIGGKPVADHVFDSDSHRTVKIGRLPKAQLRLDDASVARIHAVIDFSGGVATITDMGSTAGTLVNGSKVHKAKIAHGDVIQVGQTQLEVGVGQPVQPPVVAAPMPQPGQAPVQPGQMPAPNHPPAQAFVNAPAPGSSPLLAKRPPAGQPHFDGGGRPGVRRISTGHLTGAAVESRPHPSLPPEPKMTNANRVLEMRAYWGEALLAVHHYDKPQKITIGESKGTDFFISSEGLPTEVFPMIRYIGDEYVLTYCDEMEGELEIGGVLSSLSSLRSSSLARRDDDLSGSVQVRLPADSRGIVHWGGATFALRFVAPTQPPPTSLFQNLDFHYVTLLIASMLLHFVVVAVLVMYPYETAHLRVDLFDDDTNAIEALILEEPKKDEKREERLKKLTEKLERDKKKVAQKRPTKATLTKVKVPVRQPSAAEKKANVKNRFSKLLRGGGAGAGSLLGGAGGGSLSGTLSNVIGTAGKGSGAMAGLGIRGSAALTGGGLGTSRGIAGIGTAGRLGGGGLKYGSGVGLGGRAKRGMITLETPRVVGALPKEVIQRVINQHKQQIRYCYETQLQRQQNLKGRIEMKWVIAATGRVATVRVNDSSMRSPPVERCIAAKIKTWVFPPPAGGGVVEVKYPFVFQSN